jgi:uncharacterized protein YuzE
MEITYDPEANAAYIQLVTRIAPGEASEQVDSIETPGGRGEVILDFDSIGRLLGIEVLNAQDVLPAQVIRDATSFR